MRTKKMIGAQPRRTVTPGGFTGSNAPKRREDRQTSEQVIREAANKFLFDRGVPSMQYCSRNEDRRLP